jgi:uncharacterized membrane protein
LEKITLFEEDPFLAYEKRFPNCIMACVTFSIGDIITFERFKSSTPNAIPFYIAEGILNQLFVYEDKQIVLNRIYPSTEFAISLNDIFICVTPATIYYRVEQ